MPLSLLRIKKKKRKKKKGSKKDKMSHLAMATNTLL